MSAWPIAALELSGLLAQKDYWLDVHGHRIALSDIDRRYARNILRLMQQSAPDWKVAIETIYVAGPQPSGEMASDAFDREFTDLLRTKPAVWIQQQPLYRAIQRRAR